jgi:sulfur carrier protein ThiS
VDAIQLTVNGEPRRLTGAATLEHLLQDLDLDAQQSWSS